MALYPRCAMKKDSGVLPRLRNKTYHVNPHSKSQETSTQVEEEFVGAAARLWTEWTFQGTTARWPDDHEICLTQPPSAVSDHCTPSGHPHLCPTLRMYPIIKESAVLNAVDHTHVTPVPKTPTDDIWELWHQPQLSKVTNFPHSKFIIRSVLICILSTTSSQAASGTWVAHQRQKVLQRSPHLAHQGGWCRNNLLGTIWNVEWTIHNIIQYNIIYIIRIISCNIISCHNICCFVAVVPARSGAEIS